ncbi:hypothetical protein [Arsenophonus symbiont of Ornithomya chloropus]
MIYTLAFNNQIPNFFKKVIVSGISRRCIMITVISLIIGSNLNYFFLWL